MRFLLLKVKENKNVSSLPSRDNSPWVRPGAFVFCERDSGTVRFQVEASPEGTLPLEQAASLLAMHCLVRGQTPQDYTMMVVPQGALLEPVGQRAGELLEAGRAIPRGVALTSRENEVLGCVLRSLSNKQIAARLNVAERTIKFHVSALLAKFKVSDRFSLIRRAMIGVLPEQDASASGVVIELPAKLPINPHDNQEKPAKARRSSGSFGIGMWRSAGNA